jgi:hypothetical protein
MIDPRLNANPRVAEAHHRVSPAGLKYLVTERVCWATGGPQKYSGRSQSTVRYLGIEVIRVAEGFEKFLNNIILNEAQLVDGELKHKNVLGRLTSHYYNSSSDTANSRLVGSWSKATRICDALANFRQLERMTASHPLVEVRLGTRNGST